ncbi:MAG: hypothetical protein CMI03_17820 [Oceanospirillaceae bacterium]|uniref:hypothetical protein n=1 Tax=unclassified Thalassolituus TaxID=2624967 RepID=UPI000C537A14|nr:MULTISPECIES: hypothetical protein [unclassified Thalassolituus]MAS26095.1 hypothetical protein [Oceanospirillaceae bacterium]MBS54601.1 hypothetical protein [Oceanospirillaceae bacterium]|tara:strand:- start:1407 stop:1862 length:456 start_codon:yes stop_codon:yes gene_type:complete
MSYSTVKDIIRYSQQLHRHASNLFEQLRDQTQRERVDMMCRLLSRHETTLAEAVEKIEEGLQKKVLDEWHQFEPGSISEALAECVDIHPDISVDELVQMALRIDDYLIDLYSQMLSEATCDGSRQLFSSLMALEKSEKMLTVRAALSANDW